MRLPELLIKCPELLLNFPEIIQKLPSTIHEFPRTTHKLHGTTQELRGDLPRKSCSALHWRFSEICVSGSKAAYTFIKATNVDWSYTRFAWIYLGVTRSWSGIAQGASHDLLRDGAGALGARRGDFCTCTGGIHLGEYTGAVLDYELCVPHTLVIRWRGRLLTAQCFLARFYFGS